ncbi:MAG: IS3 family transposase [Terriglobales bacterium]
MKPQAGRGILAVAALCAAAGVSARGFYRRFQEHAPRQANMELREAVHRVALGDRFYGYRRVTAALRQQGLVVNHKAVLRVLRRDGLLSLRKRKFVLTTNSNHPFWVYPNLAADITLTACDQLWVADITYIRCRQAFLFLAALLDAYSRGVRGWALGETLETGLPLRALEKALAGRAFPGPHVHHSDRGIQYCSREYVQRLEQAGFQVSMSRSANPYDNAKAESFMKTLKTEEVHLRQYRDLADAEARIGHFLEEVYSRRRLHSALGYLSPEQFESRVVASAGAQA